MGKKGRHRELRESGRILWYQWEFLRRNPDYRHDHEAFVAQFGDWFREKGFWYDRDVVYAREDWNFFCKEIAPRAAEICGKWHVENPFSPDWTFDKSGRHEYKPEKCAYLPTGRSAESASSSWRFLERMPIERGELPREADRKLRLLRERTQKDPYRYVQVTLDVTQPLKKLLEKTRRQIQFGQERYEHMVGDKKGKERTRRRRLDQYDKYLEIWDLRQKGLKFSQIAQRVFPREYGALRLRDAQLQLPRELGTDYKHRVEELTAQGIGEYEACSQVEREFEVKVKSGHSQVIEQRVEDHYKSAKKLILGGYKELR